MNKPQIVTWSKDGDDSFQWVSVGWNDMKRAGTPKAKALFAKAKACIAKGEDVKQVVSLLEEAGFAVVREETPSVES